MAFATAIFPAKDALPSDVRLGSGISARLWVQLAYDKLQIKDAACCVPVLLLLH